MRMGSNVPVRLVGIGHYFPGEPVTNRFFEEQEGLGIDDRWIVEHTGVSARHWAGDDERHMDLAARAVRMALADAGTEASEVDLLIGTTATARPSTNPTTRENSYADLSLPLQAQLGMTKAACFDVSALACAGFLHASLVVQALLGASDAQTAVVACAESPRPILTTFTTATACSSAVVRQLRSGHERHRVPATTSAPASSGLTVGTSEPSTSIRPVR